MKNLIQNKGPDFIDGEITMAGVLRQRWEELSRCWNDKTQQQYATYYNDVILPYFSEFPLSHYNDKSFFDDIVMKIRENGTMQSQKKGVGDTRIYSDRTLQKIRYLMRKVLVVAKDFEGCADVLWGTDYTADEREALLEVERKRKSGPWRSFTPQMETRIAEEISEDPEQSGVMMALFLMWVFGLRNNEACGLVFGDIIPIREHPGHYRIAVLKSTEGNTNDLKTCGKNPNMYRYIPIPESVYLFLMQRKQFILDKITNQEIVFSENDRASSVDELPIACDKNFKDHCASLQVTNAGRNLFSSIGMSEDEFYWLSVELMENDIPGENKDEPTAYTFRRNFATTLSILGFSFKEQQYLMGHKFHDTDQKRCSFSNPDIMEKLFQKMTQRTLVNPVEIWCNDKNLDDYRKGCATNIDACVMASYHNYYKLEYRKRKKTIILDKKGKDIA